MCGFEVSSELEEGHCGIELRVYVKYGLIWLSLDSQFIIWSKKALL